MMENRKRNFNFRFIFDLFAKSRIEEDGREVWYVPKQNSHEPIERIKPDDSIIMKQSFDPVTGEECYSV